MSLLPTLYKDYYAEADLTAASLAKVKFLKEVVRIKDRGSDVTRRPIVLRGSRVIAGSYGAAKTQAGSTDASGAALEWLAPRGNVVTLHYTRDVDIALSGDPDSAWVNARVAEAEAHHGEHMLALEDRVLAQSGGAIGAARYDNEVYAGANGSSPTFSLTFEGANFGATRYLRVGDRVVLSAGDGSSVAHTQLAGVGHVIEINHSVGYARVSATSGGAAGQPNAAWTDNTTFFVFRDGMFQPGVQSNILNSVEDYLTRSAPSGTLNGVNRSSDEALGGQRLSAAESAGLTVMQRIMAVADRIVSTGKSAAKYKAYVSPKDFTFVVNQQASLGLNNESFVNEYGTQSLRVICSLGSVEVVALPRKANGSGWLLPVEGDDQLEIDAADGKIGRHTNTSFDIASTSDARWETTLTTYATLTMGSPSVYGIFSTL